MSAHRNQALFHFGKANELNQVGHDLKFHSVQPTTDKDLTPIADFASIMLFDMADKAIADGIVAWNKHLEWKVKHGN